MIKRIRSVSRYVDVLANNVTNWSVSSRTTIFTRRADMDKEKSLIYRARSWGPAVFKRPERDTSSVISLLESKSMAVRDMCKTEGSKHMLYAYYLLGCRERSKNPLTLYPIPCAWDFLMVCEVIIDFSPICSSHRCETAHRSRGPFIFQRLCSRICILSDLRSSQRWLWRALYSRMWRRVVR
jgi:hypothetical protein